MNDEIYCPKCGSSQLSANKKGFSGGKAVGGALIAGPLGIAAGTLGSNKVKITCLKCGHVFKPGEGRSTPYVLPKKQEAANSPEAAIIGIIGILGLIGGGIFLLVKIIQIFN